MSVGYEQRQDVAVITLDRPEVLNSVDAALAEQFTEALARAGREARAAVVSGAGNAFCAGADLGDLMAEYERSGPDLAQVIHDRFNPMVEALAKTPVPTIAAVNGLAAGAGLGLALACDLRVISSQAYLMSAFINVALIPDSGTSWLLPAMIGLARATEIAMTGRRVGAEEAQRIGLVHRVVAPEAVLPQAVGWAEQLAAGPTRAYAETRAILQRAASSTLGHSLSEEERVQGMLGREPAHLEGTRAFLEKRKPDFRDPAP